MNVLDLPEDVLSLVFVLLEPKDFLALCCSSKLLYTNYQKDSAFWRTKASTTFRTPISPLLKADGARWYHLYRRLKTQTRLYTWGQGLKGNLGHGMALRHGPPGPPMLRGRRGGRAIVQPPRLVFQRTTSTWPTEAHVPDEVGVIADLQCGGWSTIILSSAGKLYATGSINSANYVNVGSQTDRFERLDYLTQSTSAISQFSAGRTHILALTDDNAILSWDRINAKGLKVYSRYGGTFPGKPTRVVAGWGESSAYIPDTGIVYWSPLKNDQEDDMLDGREVKEKVVPDTARTVDQDGNIREVIAYILLEGIVLYITSDSRIRACDIGHENQEDTEPRSAAVQLPGFASAEDQLKDVQGSFRNFVVFTSSGRVLRGDTDYVGRCFHAARAAAAPDVDGEANRSDPATWENLNDLVSSRPRDLPALQHSGVIAVRFGDWHYQALHSNGKITSHGHEPESCGALGFGEAHHGGKLRGLYTGPLGSRQDTKLRAVADLRGRQVWFEPEKRDWLQHLQKTAEETFSQNRDQPYWLNILHDPVKQTVFSEWIEQEGRHWEDGPQAKNTNLSGAVDKMKLKDSQTEDFHLDPYFALAIGAAGWHSGALVLVDEERAEETRQKWLAHPSHDDKVVNNKPGDNNSLDMLLPGQFPQSPPEEEDAKPNWVTASFPRIKFPDGSESPLPPGMTEQQQTLGSALRPWRDGMPSLQELGFEQT
ncbi:hypothetical protein LTR70_006486 [Exophiala xenobiotica]|uniref:F-box domain-containing protein n=1 Tax=Lithohypha guttulata TaxID=1690604 RepID=A0ABR0JZ01_9EURO|nr:hypothetical protein LTR24_009096 [Lithohypha guttulata]KAK5315934.1 hypothetical protein LTR70_006486 [Exophiala xenobiotica]